MVVFPMTLSDLAKYSMTYEASSGLSAAAELRVCNKCTTHFSTVLSHMQNEF